MPFFWEDQHYRAIVALLLSGDVQAKVVSNIAQGIAVSTDDGRTIVWGNGFNDDSKVWAYSVVQPDGSLMVGKSALAYTADAESVALMIVSYDYDQADTVDG